MSSYLKAIAALGSGSLHPGGFTETLNLLRNFTIAPDEVILDVGCGTGRTACHMAKTYGAHVFALDNSKTMLAKAKSRAFQEGTDVHFVLGDVLDLPFKDEVADLVVVESVLIFLPVQAVLRECFRVLKRKGYLVCLEMLANESLPRNEREELKTVCGLPQIPSYQEWLDYFQATGFTLIRARQNRFPGPLESLKELFFPDPYRVVSQELGSDPKLFKALYQYQGVMLRNRRHLGFGTFILKKE
jgi:SAM-dependent methyltransferase